MNNKPTVLSKSYVTPWTLRTYDALPGNPLWIGIGFTVGLLLVFLVGRALVGGADTSSPNELRVAIIHILLTGYNASAYAYVLIAARKTTQDLSPLAVHSSQWQSKTDQVGKYPRGLLPLIGSASYIVMGIITTGVTTAGAENPWDWQGWSYDVYWHRATTVLFVWWLGCLCYVLVAESARLSNLSDDIESPDVFDLDPYQPLIRQGLTNVLLAIGVVSIMSLFLVESRYGPALMVFWIAFIGLAWLGMLLPLRGMRRRIRIAKAEELDWCRRALKAARDELRSGASDRNSITEIIAYRDAIESIKNWPFDNSTVIRFSLYIMIPLGSWLGGAIVERGLDFFLS